MKCVSPVPVPVPLSCVDLEETMLRARKPNKLFCLHAQIVYFGSAFVAITRYLVE